MSGPRTLCHHAVHNALHPGWWPWSNLNLRLVRPRRTVGQRERKRRKQPVAAGYARGRERDERIRAELPPLAPGERPRAVTVAAVVAVLLGAANLVLMAAGFKLHGKTPAIGGVVVFTALMALVGMMREFRDAEIADYVRYLDLLSTETRHHLTGASPRVVVLGFSQGTATVCRWLDRSTKPHWPRKLSL